MIRDFVRVMALAALCGVGRVRKDTQPPEPVRPHYEPEPPEKCPKCAIGTFKVIRHPDVFKAAAGVRLGRCLRKRCGFEARLTPIEED